MKRRALASLAAISLLLPPGMSAGVDRSQLPDEWLTLEDVAKRPRPPIEIGEPFLGPGRVASGLKLPTGATWQPRLVIWGRMRTAVQALEPGDDPAVSEWVNRLDLFVQLSLTGTERIVVSISPLNDGSQTSGYTFDSATGSGAHQGFNADIRSLYFEGELAELIPALDRADRHPLDLGLTVGRIPVLFQDGLLIDDSLNAFGLAKNSIRLASASNLRLSTLVAWSDIHRGGDNSLDRGATLYGLFAEADLPASTIAADLVYVDGGEASDSVHAGVSSVRRLGPLNTTLRLLASYAADGDDEATGTGLLLTAGLSHTPERTHDLAYLNLFAAIDRYTPAARASDLGGPLGRLGILFDGSGVGNFSAPLADDASDAVGAAVGYHKMLDGGRTQLLLELATRHDHDDGETSLGVGARLQRALGRRFVLRSDLLAAVAADNSPCFGGRAEFMVKF